MVPLSGIIDLDPRTFGCAVYYAKKIKNLDISVHDIV